MHVRSKFCTEYSYELKLAFTGSPAGKPCVFPFSLADCAIVNPENPSTSFHCKSFDQTVPITYMYTCTNWKSADNTTWCSTRNYLNNTRFVSQWGFCKPGCNGEYVHQARPENLARPSFHNLWQTRIFNLQSYLYGHCHTYMPNETFSSGADGRLSAYGVVSSKEYSRRGWRLFIHSNKVTSAEVINHNKSFGNFLCQYEVNYLS